MIQGALMFADEPRRVGEEAATRCATKAEKVSDFDSFGASRFIYGALVRHGPTPGEALTDLATLHGYRPHDARAYGYVFQTLVRRGQIRCIGFCERKKGNGTAGGRIWQAVL